MMTIDVIDKLYESGDLRSLVVSGIIDPSVLEHRKIYHAFYKYKESNGVTNVKAAKDVGAVFGVSDRTVYRVLSRMNYTPPKR